MKLKPQQWTHHHTHRLYHLSLALVFSFITLSVLAGSLTNWIQVQAGTISDSNDTDVMATVPEIAPGPIFVGGTGCAVNCPPSVPPPVPTPPPNSHPGPQTITIVPEPSGQIPQKTFTRSGQSVLLYTFPTSKPSFSGQTSIANARVFITINSSPVIHSTTLANAGGYWFWASPVPLANGFYTISVMGQDAVNPAIEANASLDFAVEGKISAVPPQGGNKPGSAASGPGQPAQPGSNPTGSGPVASRNGFLNIFLQIPFQYKTPNPGERVLVNIQLIDNDLNHVLRPQDITYTIENSEGKVILESTDTIMLDKSLVFSKAFIINPYVTPGLYTIIAQVRSNNDSLAVASDTFKVNSPPPHDVPAAQPYFPWEEIIALLLLLLFALIAVAAYHKVAMTTVVINKEDEKNNIIIDEQLSDSSKPDEVGKPPQ